MAALVGFDRKRIEEAQIHLSKADPVLARAMDVLGPCDIKLREAESTFAALAEIIVYQQLSPSAAQTIWSRLKSVTGDDPGSFNPFAFSLLTDDQIRNAGISRAKLSAMRNAAQAARNKTLPSLTDAVTMPEDELRNSLMKIKGIGNWSVDMFLTHYVGHPDVLPLQDSAILRGFARIYGVSDHLAREIIVEHSMKWRPYRSLVSRYLWAAVDSRAFERTI